MNDDPLIGKQLSNFRLERILGRGGMGQVYFGRDIRLNRPVAVKVIDARLRSNPTYAKRFIHEAQIIAAWRHENIAQVYYADEQDSLYYFAMEYINGQDLAEKLIQLGAKNEKLPESEVLRIGRAIAGALDYAHARDVIHRDVKPSNVLVDTDGRVVLTDFGLALDTQQGSVGEVFGTAHYIAPEQARRSSDAVPQSDLYSLGIMLYEMLTGSVPFDDPSPTSVALQHIMQTPPPPRLLNPQLNEATEQVLLKALEKTPQERYQSGKELLDALENALTGRTAAVSMPLPPLPPGVSFPAPVQKAAAAPTASIPTRVVAAAPAAAANTTQPVATAPRAGLPIAWIAGLGGCAIMLLLGVIIIGSLVFFPALRSGSPTDVSTLAFATETSAGIVATTAGVAENPTEAPAASQETVPPDSTQAAAKNTKAPATTPTILYPNGKKFKLFYNDSSLYFLNLSDSNIPINWVAFERLNSAGKATNRFNGSRWGEFYGTLTSGWCMALEILDAKSYLRPGECGHNNKYLSMRTPVKADETVFWTTQEGSRLFRVLWREGGKDQEVARCEIKAGSCEVYLP